MDNVIITNIMFLYIIRCPVCYLRHLQHRPVYISKHNVSETGLCLRLHLNPTQLGPIDRSSPCLWRSPFCLYSKHDVSETRLCLRLQLKPTQLVPINRARPCLRRDTVLFIFQKTTFLRLDYVSPSVKTHSVGPNQ
jgi:hypothetical protein